MPGVKLKKGRQSELQTGLRQLLEEVQSSRNPRLLVEENGCGILITLNLIGWAEADRNYLKLHIGDRTYTVRGTVESIEKKLDFRAVPADQSLLIDPH